MCVLLSIVFKRKSFFSFCTVTMTTQQVYNHDDGIGFDMRNAQLYQDSDDEEEEEINRRDKPHSYNNNTNNSNNNTCCYIVLILIIIASGSIIGYSLGSTF
eukprot:192009_1